jgi:hypothetical protein
LCILSTFTFFVFTFILGGTADITCHQKDADGKLRELQKASGGAWGGTRVDEAFNQLLIKIVGAAQFRNFRSK